jgi:hypothetical protein
MGLSGDGVGSNWHGKGTLSSTLTALQSEFKLCYQS